MLACLRRFACFYITDLRVSNVRGNCQGVKEVGRQLPLSALPQQAATKSGADAVIASKIWPSHDFRLMN